VEDQRVTNVAEQIAGVEQKPVTRQRRSMQQKRQMVEATLVPGASIARVARAYGVNANQLFHWRKLYSHGLLEDASTSSPKLLPVRVADVPPGESITSAPVCEVTVHSSSARSICIEIAGKARMTIAGFDEHSLRTVLEYLLR
jgi:transposase